MKNVGRETVVRHIDYLLQQAQCIIGEVAYCYIYKSAKSNSDDETDTLGHVMLKNPKNHKQLAFMLNGFNFHGRKLLAALSYHYFSSIDDEYVPRPIKQSCGSCNKFENFVMDKEDRIKQEAIDRSIQNVHVHKSVNKYKTSIVESRYNNIVSTITSNNYKNAANSVVEEQSTNYVDFKFVENNKANNVRSNSCKTPLGIGRGAFSRLLQSSRSSTPNSTANSSIVVVEEPQESFEMILKDHSD